VGWHFIGEREANAIAPAVVAEKKEGKEGKDEKKEGEGKPAARQDLGDFSGGRRGLAI